VPGKVQVGMLGLSIRSIENRFIFFPPRRSDRFASPHFQGTQSEEIWLRANDGVKLNARYFPCPTSCRTILWFHGNAEDLYTSLAQQKFYAGLGVNLLALDYRGYGRSEGVPTEDGLYLDADAAYYHLVGDRRLQPEQIVILGHSLGGVVAIDLASRRKCGGLIVESSLTTAKEMVRRILGIPFMGYVPRTRFNSLSKIPGVRASTLIVHGTQDTLIPFSMGERLFENAPEPKFFYPIRGAGHNNILELGGEKYLQRLRTFMDGLSAKLEV
jgi:uncharacterized protein